MPRQGGIYYLPSPPSPYVAGTLASATDINSSLDDIAVALTNSLPTDGSAAMTGSLNMNGQAISGVSTLGMTGAFTTGAIAATSSISSPQYYGTNIDATGTILTNLGRIISVNSNNNPSVTVWDTAQNNAAGMYFAPGGQLAFGPVDGNGNPDAPDFAAFTAPGNLSVRGTVTAAGFSSNGNINAPTITAVQVSITGPLFTSTIANSGTINTNGDIFMQNHYLRDVGNILGYGGTLTVGSPMFVAGDIHTTGWLYGAQLVTTNGGGMAWSFTENGGYGVATSSSGAQYLWQPALADEAVAGLPRAVTRDVPGAGRVVDVPAALVALYDALNEVSDRLAALEALTPA